MSYLPPFITPLQSPVQKVQFSDPNGVVPSFTVNLNPRVAKHKPSNLRKFTVTTNSTSVILGSSEAPPSEISLSWPMIDSSQLAGIQPFENISPCVVTLNNDDAYLCLIVIDSVEQLSNFTRKIYALDISLLVLSPYNGLTTSLNTLVAPTIVATSVGTGTGYIQNPSDIYLWQTVFSKVSSLAESVVSPVTHIHNTTVNNSYTLSWTVPTSKYYSKARIYWNTTNSPTTATLLTEVLSGFPQDTPSTFSLFNSYVTYNNQLSPTFGLSFTGYWSGGLWVQDT